MAKFKLEDGTEVEAFTSDEVKTMIGNEVAGLKAKRDELLGLHAKEKERLSELEESQRKAEEERQREKGEFKSLYEKTQSELESERDNARKFRQQVQDRDLDSNANSLVSELTRDSKRAELLRKEALQFAKYTEDGIQYEIGGVTVDADKVKQKLTEEYPFLVDGSQANGGGAQGAAKQALGVKKASEYTEAERVSLYKEDPVKFKEIFN